MTEVGIPHDAFFKQLMAAPGAAGALIQERLPEAVAACLAPDTPELVAGTFVDEALASHHSDLLYRVRLRDGQAAYVYVLIEHKSAPEPMVALQLLRYMVRIWDRAVREGERQLPAIVPLVVYHGAEAWRVPTGFASLCGSVASELAPYVPDFRFELADLGRIEDERLSGLGHLRAGLMALKYIFADQLVERLPDLLRAAGEGDWQFVIGLLNYILSASHRLDEPALRAGLQAALPGEEERIMSTLAEKWFNQGVGRGRDLGKAEGRAEGKAEGKAEMLLRLMERRFGRLPAARRDQVLAADLATLDRLTDRLLEAASLDDLLGPAGPQA